MRKSDLVVHVETHKKNIITCGDCDHTTTLPKYMKEHIKVMRINCHINVTSVTNVFCGGLVFGLINKRNMMLPKNEGCKCRQL